VQQVTVISVRGDNRWRRRGISRCRRAQAHQVRGGGTDHQKNSKYLYAAHQSNNYDSQGAYLCSTDALFCIPRATL
jgi:hypothetical protein